MRFLLLFILFFSIRPVCSAQVTHVYYDAFHDTLRFEQNDTVVKAPIMKKGSRIEVHVSNYNDYLYELSVTTESSNYTIPAGGADKLFGTSAGSVDLLKGLVGGGSLTDLEKANVPKEDEAYGAAGEQKEISSQLQLAQPLLAELNSTLEGIEKLEDDLQNSERAMQNILFRQEQIGFMLEEVDNLRTNTTMSPNSSRKLMLRYLEKSLDLEPGDDYDLDDLISQSNAQQNFQNALNNYQTYAAQITGKSASARTLIADLQAMNLPANYSGSLPGTLLRIEQRNAELKQAKSQLSQKTATLKPERLTDIANALTLYEGLKDHRFEKTVVLYPDGDITTINISLSPKGANKVDLATKRASPIKIESYAGLQINASVGVSFASYFDQPKEYVNVDDRIFGEDLDAFEPIITSFVHFYGQSKRNVSLAGTLGIGVGVGNGDDRASTGLANYFLGPSLIVGKGQRIVLTTGLMGGRVIRLARGQMEGDALLDGTIEIQTKTVTELGFFLGASFNVAGN